MDGFVIYDRAYAIFNENTGPYMSPFNNLMAYLSDCVRQGLISPDEKKRIAREVQEQSALAESFSGVKNHLFERYKDYLRNWHSQNRVTGPTLGHVHELSWILINVFGVDHREIRRIDFEIAGEFVKKEENND